MKKLSVLFVFILLLQFGNCDSSYPDITNIQTNNVEPFKDFLDKFIKAFNEKNISEINKCISTEYGLFILDNPGAFAIVEHYNSFDEIMNLEGEFNVGYLKALQVNCVFIEGEIPHYNCDNDKPEGWNKQGCFYKNNQTLSITNYYRTMLEYRLGNAAIIKTDMKVAEISEKYATHLAYSTDACVGFYFGIIDNNWFLICIDKITPCDA